MNNTTLLATEGESIFGILETAVGYYVLVPILVGIFQYKNLPGFAKPIFYLLIVSLAVDTAVDLISSADFNTNHFMRVFSVIEFTLLSVFFSALTNSRRLKIAMRVMIFVFVLVEIGEAIYNGVEFMDSNSMAIESVFCILYCIMAFLSILRSTHFSNILSSVVFWILTAILVYFSGNFIVFVFSTYVMNNSPEMFEKIWTVHSALYFMFNTLVAIGFWKARAHVN